MMNFIFFKMIFKDSDGQPPMTQMLSMDQKSPRMFRRFNETFSGSWQKIDKWPRVWTLLGIWPPSEVVFYVSLGIKDFTMEDKDPPF